MAGFSDFYNDPTIRFDHTPVIAKFAFQVNHVGAHDSDSISVATFTPTDANSIFVSDTTGNDTTGDGTSALPYKTILKGIDQTTALKTYVIIQDSVLYVEDISSATTTFFQGMYAASGQTPTFTTRLLGYIPADANSIFFDKTGNDGSAGTQAAPKLTIAGAVAATDGTHQAIVCQDSETYTEPGIEFTGNFLGMYAADGEKPTYIPTITDSLIDTTSTADNVVETVVVADNPVDRLVIDTFSNDNIIITFPQDDGTPHGKFVIYSKNGTTVKGLANINGGSATANIRVGIFSDDSFVLVYSDGNSGRFEIFDSSGTSIVSEVTFSGNVTASTCIKVLDNDNFVIACEDDNTDGQFWIYDKDGGAIKAKTQFDAARVSMSDTAISLLSNTNFVIAYGGIGGGTDGSFIIFDEDGGVVKAKTQFEAHSVFEVCTAVLENTNFVIAYWDSPDVDCNFIIYNEAGTGVVGKTQFLNGKVLDYCLKVTPLLSGGFFIDYAKFTNADGYYIMFNADGSSMQVETLIKTSTLQSISCKNLSDGSVCMAYANASNIWYTVFVPYSWSGIKISDTSEINGWLLDGNDSYQLNKIIEINGSKLTTKWCDLFDCTNPTTDSIKGYAINGDNEIDVYNSKIYDNDGGVYLTANVDDCIIDDSHFYRNNGTWAIQVDGAAAGSGDITIEHNDIFQNYAGIYLENNHGTNEILKNNIIHNNSNEGVKATTAATITYTVRTDDNDNVSDGTDVFFSNPLYVNEGAVSEALIDLNIKTLIVGYPTDSPAKGQADDSRNCGSYDVRYIGSITTWTSIEIDKPLRGNIDANYDPVGGHLNIASDGTPTYSKKGQTVGLKLTYVGTKNAEFLLVLTMWASNDSTVRVFPDPTTNPDTYETMVMVREKLKGSAKNYKLTRTGKEGVVLAFLRKFEI